MHRLTDPAAAPLGRTPRVPAAPSRFLRLVQRTQGTAVLVSAHGEIDLATAATLDRCLHAAATHAPAPVVLDLTAIGLLTSAGLKVLRAHHHGCVARGTRLHVVATGRAVLHPIRIVGLDRVLTLHTSVPAALAGIASR